MRVPVLSSKCDVVGLFNAWIARKAVRKCLLLIDRFPLFDDVCFKSLNSRCEILDRIDLRHYTVTRVPFLGFASRSLGRQLIGIFQVLGEDRFKLSNSLVMLFNKLWKPFNITGNDPKLITGTVNFVYNL